MNVTREPVADRQAVLHVEVDEDHLERHLERAYRRLVQRTNIPGFRKGKAPRRIFETMVGRDTLVEEALETLVPDAVAEAIKQEEIEAYGTPRVSVTSRDPLPQLDVTVPLEPTVKLGDYHALQITEEPEEVTDEQVEQALETAREGEATWEPVERPLEMGDQAVLTVEGIVDGEPVINGEDTEYVLDADGMTPVPGFAEALTGLAAGDSKEFTVSVPDDFPGPAVAGKEVRFEVQVSDVKERIVPELDDDLARSVGRGYETLDEMRKAIRSEYEAAAQAMAERRLQDRVMDELTESTEFEIPPLIVDHEVEHVLHDQQQQLARYKVSVGDYMRTAGKSSEELVNEARESAVLRLKRTLLIEEVAKAEGIEVSDEDLAIEIEALVSDDDPESNRESLESDEGKASVRSMVTRRRAVQRLLEIVKSEEDEPGNPPDDEAPEAPSGDVPEPDDESP